MWRHPFAAQEDMIGDQYDAYTVAVWLQRVDQDGRRSIFACLLESKPSHKLRAGYRVWVPNGCLEKVALRSVAVQRVAPWQCVSHAPLVGGREQQGSVYRYVSSVQRGQRFVLWKSMRDDNAAGD